MVTGSLGRATCTHLPPVCTGDATTTTLPGEPLTFAVPTCCVCAGGCPIGVESKFDWNSVYEAQAESNATKMMQTPRRAVRSRSSNLLRISFMAFRAPSLPARSANVGCPLELDLG